MSSINFANGINNLGLLLCSLDNIEMISGYSIYMALFLLLLGEDVNRDIELLNLLGVRKEMIEPTLVWLSKNKSVIKQSAKTSDCVFIRSDFEVKSTYIKAVQQLGSIKKVNFIVNLNRINNYIAEKTNNQIKNILTSTDISEDTELIIVNTIYFNKKWIIPFRKKNEGTFTQKSGNKVKLLYMVGADVGNYYEDSSKRVFEKYYHDNVVMGIIIGDYLSIKSDDLNNIIYDFREIEVKLHIPKFKQDVKITLEETLKTLGINKIFNKESSVFSNISHSPLYVSKIIHQAKISVDEEGTEASAATMVIMNREMSIMPKKILEFKADKTFMWYIRDVKTNIILFNGIYDGK